MYNEKQEEKLRQEQFDKQVRQQQMKSGLKRGSVTVSAGSKKASPRGGGIGQQLSSLVGGLFSGGGIRIGDAAKIKGEGSPPSNRI